MALATVATRPVYSMLATRWLTKLHTRVVLLRTQGLGVAHQQKTTHMPEKTSEGHQVLQLDQTRPVT